MAKMLGSKMMSSGRHAGFLDQQLVGALADGDLALDSVRLPLLVERHDHGGRTVATQLTGVLEEDLLAFLEADRVDDALALHALEPGLDDATTWRSRA